VNLADFEKVEKIIRASKYKICAIGEVGLDFTPRYLKNGDEDKKQQREVFRRQIEIANEFGMPV
jgi:TatD DNase family protein